VAGLRTQRHVPDNIPNLRHRLAYELMDSVSAFASWMSNSTFIHYS
jgi:hypothetical protein